MNLFDYDKRKLGKQARELGFIRDTLEKVFRLSEILKYINSDPLLRESLALKGGTAINMTIFNLPRLSVDIDLDYTHNDSREEMFEERQKISDSVLKYMVMSGYELSPKSKSYHSLDSYVFSYANTAGMKDNIKVEINYSRRHQTKLPQTATGIIVTIVAHFFFGLALAFFTRRLENTTDIRGRTGV